MGCLSCIGCCCLDSGAFRVWLCFLPALPLLLAAMGEHQPGSSVVAVAGLRLQAGASCCPVFPLCLFRFALCPARALLPPKSLHACVRVGLFQGWSSPHRPARDASPPAFAPGHATAVVLAPAQAIHLCAAPTPAILVLWQPVCSGCCLCAQATHIHSYILLVMKLWSVACVVWGSQRCRT